MADLPHRPLRDLPRCGLYRTTVALPGAESVVAAGMLVSFHDHSESGTPAVLVPAFNVFNRWKWTTKPIFVEERSWIETMQPLPAEGFYALRADLPLAGAAGRWAKGTLVQLGYDRSGVGIVFIAQLRHDSSESSLWFAERGERLSDDRLDLLEPLLVYEEPDPTTAGAEKKNRYSASHAPDGNRS